MKTPLQLLFDQSFESSARFSECRRYRYELWRKWDNSKPYAMFIGLNPSTADEAIDDPTIRRCIAFSKSWGFGSLCMTNLFAFRATDPEVMKSESFPIGGHENDLALRSLADGAGVVVAAWGVHGTHLDRAAAVMKMLPKLHCLGLSKDGHPRHPLYMRSDCKPIPFQ